LGSFLTIPLEVATPLYVVDGLTGDNYILLKVLTKSGRSQPAR